MNHNKYIKWTFEERVSNFWNRVRKTPYCWLWLGSKTTDGYGSVAWGASGKNKRAHRLSWELMNGSIPNGFEVCHQCDVPACVNPAHLYLGTHAQNMRDLAIRGNGKQKKLSNEDVRQIRLRRKGQTPRSVLAKEYGVHVEHITAITRGIKRRHV